MACSRTDVEELLASIIIGNRNGSREDHLIEFSKTVRSRGYEEHLDKIIAHFFSFEYLRVTRAIQPSSKEELKKRGNLRTNIERAKAIIAGNLMEMMTPLNKPLKDCTGEECLALGGFYEHIGSEAGKQLIGEYFTEDELQRAMTDRIS